MITVQIFGQIRLKTGEKELTIEADDIHGAFNEIVRRLGNISIAELKQSVIFINGVSIDKLKMFHTKLMPGDRISLLSPISGG